MKYKHNWEATQQKWANYWTRQNTGRPLMCIIARKPEIEGLAPTGDVFCQGSYYHMPAGLQHVDMEDKHQTASRMVERYRYFCDQHDFMGESFPNMTIDFGPGSLAAYLGCDIGFREDTVWFEHWMTDLAQPFHTTNGWYEKHLQLAKDCVALAKGDFLVAMPDLMEGLDTMASLRGTSETLLDTMLNGPLLQQRVDQVNNLYYNYADPFLNTIAGPEGGNAYTVFQIWGPGRTLKLQCDISAMLSPQAFRDLAVPGLRAQAQKADHVLYHLDGPGAIRHLDALMEIAEIDALQWTSGDTGPDGTDPQWDPIYDQATQAGKAIWVKVYTGEFEDWIANCDRLVQKYGTKGLFFYYPEMSHDQGVQLLDYAETHWK